MLIKPLINPRSVRQYVMGRIEPETDDRERMPDGCMGTIIRVYPVGHSKNQLAQMMADVHVSDRVPLLHKVPISSPHAHQETEIAAPDTRHRNPYAPKSRNRIDGSTFDLRPGTKVWVQFMNQDFREPVITGTVKFNYQGDLGFPIDKMVVHPFDESGEDVAPAERFPLDSDLSEYPRAVPFQYNGVRGEIDNRGNFSIQATIDREPVFPGDNEIPGSPDPEGNISISTKGAPQGNQGRFTGIHPVTGETNAKGNIVDESKLAGVGKHIERLIENGDGSRLLSMLLNAIGNSQITLEQNGQGSYGLRVAQNGVGSWVVLVENNGEGRWGVTIQNNPNGAATLDVKNNGDGSRKVNLESNGLGDYEVNSKANASGAHRHTSLDDGDGHMERSIASAGDGSILDRTKDGGVGNASRTTKDCGEGSILDKTDTGGKGRIDRQTISSTDGTMRDQTDSPEGHIVHQTKAQSKGWMWASTRNAIQGKIYFEDRERKGYWFLDPDLSLSEIWAELKAVISCNDVRLGSRDAPYNIVLWPQLDTVMQVLTLIFDTHVHEGVTTGEDATLVPTPAIQNLTWMELGPDCRSDVVFADKDASSEPEFQDDPDAGAEEFSADFDPGSFST